MTRTDDGYAYWKEIPSVVRDARKIATGNIASAMLKQAVTEALTPFVYWLNTILTSKGKP